MSAHTQDNKQRCAVCGWSLADSMENGCVRGDCSQRPPPDHFYDQERAESERRWTIKGTADWLWIECRHGVPWMECKHCPLSARLARGPEQEPTVRVMAEFVGSRDWRDMGHGVISVIDVWRELCCGHFAYVCALDERELVMTDRGSILSRLRAQPEQRYCRCVQGSS